MSYFFLQSDILLHLNWNLYFLHLFQDKLKIRYKFGEFCRNTMYIVPYFCMQVHISFGLMHLYYHLGWYPKKKIYNIFLIVKNLVFKKIENLVLTMQSPLILHWKSWENTWQTTQISKQMVNCIFNILISNCIKFLIYVLRGANNLFISHWAVFVNLEPFKNRINKHDMYLMINNNIF